MDKGKFEEGKMSKGKFIILFLCFVFLVSSVSGADYTRIHKHPRIWMESTDSWTAIHDKIYNDPTMLARWTGTWNAFMDGCSKDQWTWGNVAHADFFFTFAQAFIGKVENDPSWYTKGAIPNNAVNMPSIVSSYESDAPFHLMAQALTYDWLYDDLTQGQRDIIKANIETACDKIIAGGNTQDDFTQNEDFHNYHTAWISAVTMAGIALYGDSDKAETYLDWALGRMYEDNPDKNDPNIYYNFMKSMKATGGACMFEGPGYFKDAIPEISWGIEAWDTATDRYYDMWGSSDYFQQMENAGYAIIYMHTPAGNRFKEEDATYSKTNYIQSYNMILLPLLESRFSNGYFKQFIDDEWSGVADWGSWSSGQIGRKAFYFLFFDPSVVSQTVSDLSKDKRLGEYTIIKNGWTTDDTYITFKAGYHWKSHCHADHGNFQIYKGDNLLTGKSGWYDTSSWGAGSHRMAWAKQTISSNGITIYDSSEEFKKYDDLYVNSGGQRLMNFMRSPPFSSVGTLLFGGGAMLAGGGHDVADLDYGVTNRYEELARYGTVLASELNHADYSYIKSDITKAYTNAYSGYGDNNNAKADLVQRELVYLKPNYILVYDIVDTTDSSHQVSFITHQPYEPEVYDTVWQNPGTGISDYPSGDKARWDYGADRVFQETLLPDSNMKYHVIGGSGYSCYIEDTLTNYPPNPSYVGGRSEIAPEFLPWRIEVQPDTGISDSYNFLNFLEVTNTGQSDITSTELIESSTGNMQGVLIEDSTNPRIVLFSATGTLQNSVTYDAVYAGTGKHLLVDMQPGTYNIYKNGELIDVEIASSEGTIYFESSGGSTFVVSGTPLQTCTDAGGICCTTDQICQGGSFVSSSDCGVLCCVGGVCSTPPTCTDAGGTCMLNSCSTYQNCSSLIGTCSSGNCCSGTCIIPCVESWTCTDWSECVEDLQTRNCTDVNGCGTVDDKPVEVQSCMLQGSVFTYVFEAESGSLTSPMEIGFDEDASGGSYVFCPVSDGGVVEYTVDVPVAGEYVVWGRVIAPSDDKDSFFVGDTSTGNVWDVLYGEQSGEWTWDQVTQRGSGSFDSPEFDPRVFNLSVGQFNLTIISRERDTFLDRLVVTNNLSFSPVDVIENQTTCQLTSATWSTATATEGDTVTLIVGGTDCDGELISFEVWEDDLIGDDAVLVNPGSVSFSGGVATATWTAEWQEDAAGDPEYYFVGTLVLNSSETITSSGELVVSKSDDGGDDDGGDDSGDDGGSSSGGGGSGGGGGGGSSLECVLTNAYWSVVSAMEGEEVLLTVEGTDCDGEEIDLFVIWEDDLIGDDSVSENPASISFSDGKAVSSWTVEYQDDFFGNPEYYFVSSLKSDDSVRIDSRDYGELLRVSEAGGIRLEDVRIMFGLGLSRNTNHKNNLNQKPSEKTTNHIFNPPNFYLTNRILPDKTSNNWLFNQSFRIFLYSGNVQRKQLLSRL